MRSRAKKRNVYTVIGHVTPSASAQPAPWAGPAVMAEGWVVRRGGG
jgi:hypothetical protein